MYIVATAAKTTFLPAAFGGAAGVERLRIQG
ncbi:hypothetical protein HD594_001505 [Microbacterium thalassium]|uniref:Uncharacterized protein n=1 Tax=Microbacterium thalassium TaxID=362649 RepID=A0A7X0FQC4_9MICO|nr:hypothetical protein [Microbacterium thalassium]